MRAKNDLTDTRNNSSINLELKDDQEITQKKCPKKIKVLLISLIVLLSAIVIVCIIVFLKKKNNQKSKEKEQNEDETTKDDDKIEKSNTNTIYNNFILAKYYIEEGKNTNLLDLSLIGLNYEDYTIEYSINENKLRYLDSISNSKIIGEETGILKVNIKFKDNLKSMFGMFKGCENLIDIDLTNINTSKLENINSMFERCNNLENVNFFNKQLYNIKETDNLFNGCENLVQIENLDKINMSRVRKANNMFKNCKSIRNINLSSIYIDKAENAKDIFYGCDKLEKIDISNFEEISQDLFGNLSDVSNIKIKVKKNVVIEMDIKINILYDDYKIEQICNIGEKEKCKECKNGKYCKSCNEGYYLPMEKNYNIECKKCEKNCLKCEGFIKNKKCLKCKEGYELINDKCVKECKIGEGKNCERCGEKENKGKCLKCNEGYYLKKKEEENE